MLNLEFAYLLKAFFRWASYWPMLLLKNDFLYGCPVFVHFVAEIRHNKANNWNLSHFIILRKKCNDKLDV